MKLSYAPFIVILTFILLCSLSAWQLYRGLHKQAILKSHIDNIQRPILHNTNMSAILKNPSDYSKRIIKLKGSFQTDHTILLDNRIHNGQVGYEVITPFLIESNQCILINRGWVALGSDRKQFPKIPSLPTQTVTIKGYITIPQSNRFIKNSLERTLFLSRIQAIDFALLQSIFKSKLLPMVIQLSQDSPFSFEMPPHQTQWLTPEKHFAYALQWLLLAFSLIIIYNRAYHGHSKS